MVVLHCYICEYEFSERDFIERLACPICHGGFIEEIRHEGGDGGDEGDDFFEELGREEGDEGDDYSRAGEVPLHQMSPIPRAHLMETMYDGPPPSSSSDPMVLVRGSQCAISAGGLRRRSQGHGHMEDYCHGQLIPHMDSGSQNDMTRCRTPAAYNAVVPTVEITQRHLSINPQCAVSLDLFVFGGEAREMPCMHMYHVDCIAPWLAQNNSCPVCRHEFPEEGAYGRGNSESSNT